jgi:hypothetical protein
VVCWSCFSSYFDKFAKLEFMQICILTFQPSFGDLMQYFSYQKNKKTAIAFFNFNLFHFPNSKQIQA